jgi:hypothetical protein
MPFSFSLLSFALVKGFALKRKGRAKMPGPNIFSSLLKAL